ncbi:MAG: outer membrane beta-barrel protein [Crocinitomix sp.]|nr:outer membrane beta-barrel protein [Crocinitomix sp.]
MKFKITCVVFTFLCFFQNANAQLTGAGIQPKMNFSRHLNVEQNIPKRLARSVEGRLAAVGIDAFADFNLGEKWQFRVKAGVETKGFVSDYYIYQLDERAQKYHYVSTDLNLVRKWGDNKRIQPYNYLGLTTGYLFKNGSKTLPFYEAKTFGNGARLTYEDYSKLNLGFNLGVGLSFDDVLWLELECNRDILAPINQADMKVYNTVYSVNVGINLISIITNFHRSLENGEI